MTSTPALNALGRKGVAELVRVDMDPGLPSEPLEQRLDGIRSQRRRLTAGRRKNLLFVEFCQTYSLWVANPAGGCTPGVPGASEASRCALPLAARSRAPSTWRTGGDVIWCDSGHRVFLLSARATAVMVVPPASAG